MTDIDVLLDEARRILESPNIDRLPWNPSLLLHLLVAQHERIEKLEAQLDRHAHHYNVPERYGFVQRTTESSYLPPRGE